jgi:hypothetical protein
MLSARFAILAQKLSAGLRSSAARRLLLALVLPFVGVVAAFGIAPDTVTDTVVRENVIEDLALPALPVTDTSGETYWREARIERGDTIASILQRLEIDEAGASLLLQHTRSTCAVPADSGPYGACPDHR